jgi:septal ring factor EnvC (AmiA/AmiB activator)
METHFSQYLFPVVDKKPERRPIMSTGGSIFYTVLLIVALMILLGILLYYAVDTHAELIQTQQENAGLRADLEAARAEIDRLEVENQTLAGQLTEQGRQLEELRVLNEITNAQIRVVIGQRDEAQAQNQRLQQQLHTLEQANTMLSFLANWPDWNEQGKAIASLVAGGLATGGLATVAIGLYSWQNRGWKPGQRKSIERNPRGS